MARADASIETPLPVLCPLISRPVAARRHAESALSSTAAFELSNGGRQEYERARQGDDLPGFFFALSLKLSPPPPKTSVSEKLCFAKHFSRNEAEKGGKRDQLLFLLCILHDTRSVSSYAQTTSHKLLRVVDSIRVGERRDSRAFLFFFLSFFSHSSFLVAAPID